MMFHHTLSNFSIITLYLIYLRKLEIKTTSETRGSVLCPHLFIGTHIDKMYQTKIYDRRGDFNFLIANFPI